MNKVIIILCGFFLWNGYSFSQRTCGTMEQHQSNLDQYPELRSLQRDQELTLQEIIQENKNRGGVTDVYTIPVVVHIVYNTPVQNISEAQVLSQIDILNQDFRLLNADTNLIPAAFRPLAGDAHIEFCMATQDPQGNPSNGITRTYTSEPGFDTNDGVKFSSSGGHNAWLPNKYLNIWVCNILGSVLGYAQFPGMIASTDGVVIGTTYFGNTGNVSAPYNQGRTCTHEVGHWLGLRHIWGDDGTSCAGTDLISDTPNQAGQNFSCPSFPRTDACTDTTPGVMFMNYMDYVDDACMQMFSNGQIERMRGILEGIRASLTTSDKCEPLTRPGEDVYVSALQYPEEAFCGDTTAIVPEFTLTNWGANPLLTANINYQIDGGTPLVYPWTGNLAYLESEVVTLPVIALPDGSHTLSVFSSDPNGNVDGDTSNDNESISFFISPPNPLGTPPVFEDFETTFPPVDWTIVNEDFGLKFLQHPIAGSQGTNKSVFMNNFDYDQVGEVDEIQLPDLDLSDGSALALSFDYAYSMGADTTMGETLRVLVSTDCGASWNTEWEKSAKELSTTSPFYSPSFYIAQDEDWIENELVDLSAYSGINGVKIKFSQTTAHGNNLFLDQINLEYIVSRVTMDLTNGISVYPNPASETFVVEIDQPFSGPFDFQLTDLHGKIILAETLSGEKNPFTIQTGSIPNGLYLLKLENEERMKVQKVLISH